MGQSLTIQTCPSRSIICALISPTFSCIRSRQSFLPAMIASRASFTHAGQSESVCRGKPSVGLVFSQDLSSGLSDHFGVTEGLGLRLLKYWIVLNVLPAALQTAQSNVLAICVPTVCGINLYPPLSKMPATWPLNLLEPNQSSDSSPNDCPRAHFVCLKTVPRTTGTSNKSLDSYSLTVTLGGRQCLAPNGHFWGSNGNMAQRTANKAVSKGGY